MGNRVPETERTYVATGASREPDLEGLAGVGSLRGLDPVELDAVYFDTADLRLAARRITLRRRTGGDDAGWHLKLPSGRADTRTEVRLSLASGTARTVPKALAAEVAAHTRGRPLVRVVRIVNHRERTQLLAPDDTPLAEIAHDHVTATPMGGTAAEAIVWSETEVELLAGGRRLLDAVEERLTAARIRRSAFPSKLSRALGDRVPVVPRPPDNPVTAGDAILAYLHRRLRDILEYDPAVRRDEPDAVHRMRVATRRLRSALKTYGRELDRTVTDPIGDELKWLAGVLGAERDREVLDARLAGLRTQLPPRAADRALEQRLSGAVGHGQARTRLLQQLRGKRYFELLDRLEELLAEPPLLPAARRPAAKAVAKAVRREHRRLADRVREAIRLTQPGTELDVALHTARKAAKRARYAAESARPVLGKPARRHRKRLTEIQRLLGEHQDSVMCRLEILRLSRAARSAGEDTFAYGALHQVERDRAAAVEAALPHAWRRADRGPLAG
jgi:CHAD domain-containing protein